MIRNFFYSSGRYFLMLRKDFRKPENYAIYRSRILEEMEILGVNSLGIVMLLSVFMGAVVTLQTASNIVDNPLIPKYTIGFTARQSMILEFSPTIISLILAGKVGSVIASELGTMRVTQQIDALEIMGINSASYLILPKFIAAVLINPFLVLISMFVGILGGWFVVIGTGLATTYDYIDGCQIDFKGFFVYYALFKTMVFAFVITTVASYHGYNVKGGSLEVGQASTNAVTYSSVLILILNYVITQIMLI
jgi:phospholipid/cholesterol/gamma-HCH transport system permease protein